MKVLLDKLFPFRNIRNIAVFYVLSMVYNAWFVAAVWIFIWGAFMTKTQMGLSDSLTFTIGFLIELPSGVFADLMGRKKAIIIGSTLLVVGNLFVGLSTNFISLTGWYLVWTIGYAFQSGTTEALAYDSLKNSGFESEWNAVISSATVISRISTLTCTALGGILYTIGYNLPYLAAAAVGVIGILASLYLDEIVVKKHENRWSIHMYIAQIKDGLRTLVDQKVKTIALLSLTISSIGYMYNWGIIRPLTGERFGFTPTNFAFLLSIISLAVIFSMIPLRWLQKKIKLESLIFWVGFTFSMLFFVLGFPHSLITGGVLMIGLAVGLTYAEILFSKFINLHTKAEHRATTLSAVTLFTKMPYVALALIIGKIGDNNAIPQFTIFVGGIALILWGISFKKQFGGALLPLPQNAKK